MKLFNKMYYLVLALAVVFTLNNCSTDQISPQDEEVSKTIMENSLERQGNAPSASGQGSFIFNDNVRKFAFHANTMPDGSVQGNGVLTYTGGDRKIMFDINCLSVVGNHAIMTGVTTKDKQFPENEGLLFWFEVFDNGEGINADPDQMSAYFQGTDPIVYDCVNDFTVDLYELEGGNIQVTNNDNARQGNSGNPVIHHVSAGGNDACEALGQEPGCDGNFSLTANMRADGTVTGQWQDTFAGGGVGVHAAIDCMYVDGNMAVVGGYVTHGSFDGETDATGTYIFTKVVDNGTSNNDPADQISFSFDDSFYADLEDCQVYANAGFPLYDLTRGQVKIMSK